MTDLVYITSNGVTNERDGLRHRAIAGRLHLRQRVRSEREGDRPDVTPVARPGVAISFTKSPLALRADAPWLPATSSISPRASVPVMNCDEFFQWMRDMHGLDYGEIEF